MVGETNLLCLQNKGVLGKTGWKRAQTSAGTISSQYHTSLLDAFSQVGSIPPALCEVASWLSQGRDLGVPSASVIAGTRALQLSQGWIGIEHTVSVCRLC